MGEMTDKAKGMGNKVAGMTKEATGKVIGDKDLEASGQVQQLKGKAQSASGDVKGAMGDKF